MEWRSEPDAGTYRIFVHFGESHGAPPPVAACPNDLSGDRGLFIQTEATAESASLIFLPGPQVMAPGTLKTSDGKAADRSRLAVRLF